MLKIFENDLFFIRDDAKIGIRFEDGLTRYSVFSKVPYRLLKVYAGPKEWAIEQFWLEYEKFIEELGNEDS
jgi:hypothetical protein